MAAGRSSGTDAMTELEDEKVNKNGILTNRQKAQRKHGASLDGKGVQVDEYKDNPANRRPSSDDVPTPDGRTSPVKATDPSSQTEKSEPTEASEKVDRPGFDLGGSTGKTHAGKGLGLGTDKLENRKA